MPVVKSRHLQQPSWNAAVWRYMGFPKLFDLIIHKRLILCRADLMTDKHELLFPTIALRSRSKEFQPSDDYLNNCRTLEERCTELKPQTYLSCWSLQRSESFALWKIYLGGNNPGAAIRTNYKALMESITTAEDVRAGKVSYGNNYFDVFRSDAKELSDDHIVGFKYDAYRYENEVRVFCIKDTRSTVGACPGFSFSVGPSSHLSLTVDLRTLIHEIQLSPWCGGWFHKTFKSIIEKFEPSRVDRVKYSNIEDG
jgi:hypothetical protein